MADRYVVAEMLKLQVAGKEVGVLFFGQSIEILCVDRAESLFSFIECGRQLFTAIFPFLLPSEFFTERDVFSLTRLWLLSAEVVFGEARLFTQESWQDCAS